MTNQRTRWFLSHSRMEPNKTETAWSKDSMTNRVVIASTRSTSEGKPMMSTREGAPHNKGKRQTTMWRLGLKVIVGQRALLVWIGKLLVNQKSRLVNSMEIKNCQLVPSVPSPTAKRAPALRIGARCLLKSERRTRLAQWLSCSPGALRAVQRFLTTPSKKTCSRTWFSLIQLI